jgi:heterotetrameric sarcosine oxidase gamma subunit
MLDGSPMQDFCVREVAVAQLFLLQSHDAVHAVSPMPCTENALCLRLAPDQWLLWAEFEPLDFRLFADRGKLTDMSHAWIRLRISGPKRWGMLSKGMVFPYRPGSEGPYAVRTLCAGVSVIFLETGETDASYLLIPRSYAAWLSQWLADAAIEYLSPSLEATA